MKSFNKNLWSFLIIVIILYTIFGKALAQNKGCANILNDPRAYGNWQNARQQSDYNSIQRQNSWGNYLERSNQPSWLVNDARAKQRSMENMSENSRRTNEFFGPHNKYGK
jgi:hypothetical protein